MRLSENLSAAAILCGHRADSREEVLDRLVTAAAAAYGWDDGPTLSQMVREREAKMSTVIGMGIAVPHSRLERLDRVHVAVACLPSGVEFNSGDRKPVRLVVLLVSPLAAAGLHVQALAMVGRITESLVEGLVGAATPAAFLDVLTAWESRIDKK
jgi:nitrogen PTS system EIIA component